MDRKGSMGGMQSVTYNHAQARKVKLEVQGYNTLFWAMGANASVIVILGPGCYVIYGTDDYCALLDGRIDKLERVSI